MNMEELQARIYHLAALAELMPEFAATPGGTWLYKVMSWESDVISTGLWEYRQEAIKNRKDIESRHDLPPEPEVHTSYYDPAVDRMGGVVRFEHDDNDDVLPDDSVAAGTGGEDA